MTGDDDNGDGLGVYVTHVEFEKICQQNEKDHTHISNALWGTEGTNGMIKDIHDLKMWIKFLGIVGGVISPVLTALIIRYLLGAL